MNPNTRLIRAGKTSLAESRYAGGGNLNQATGILLLLTLIVNAAGAAEYHVSDNRFYNNLLVGDGVTRSEDEIQAILTKEPHGRKEGLGLWVYDTRAMLLQTGGNVYYHGTRPYRNESDAVRSATDPKIKVVEEGERVYLHLVLDDAVQKAKTALVTTELLGKAKISQLPYENCDGAPLRIDTDYFGKPRAVAGPTPDPFEKPGTGTLKLKLR